jgi:eukaryotic-like serine/threonine-protein kinase
VQMINELHPGDQLDHYRIETLVTTSGMSTIFRATDLRADRIVAIKVPHFEMECNPVFFDRFHREADIGRKLDHPGVVKVLALEDPSRVYMAMEWVDGRPLRELLDEQKKFSIDRAVLIAIRICDALEYIHEQGVIHRDLKPDNIMVDANDNIKLIDFGIARASGFRRLTFGKLTKTMGTPDYISPEQVNGKRGDARSDVYALGVMLYEMLTGEVPFRSPHPLAAMNERLLNNPEPPSELNSEIPAPLQDVILCALEREPENRYAGAREFAKQLENPSPYADKQFPITRTGALRYGPQEKTPLPYFLVLIIPVVIFALLLFVARRP